MAELCTIQAARSPRLDKPELNSPASPESIQFGARSPRIAGMFGSALGLLISSTRGAALGLSIAVLLLGPMTARAATYYVAPTGSDSASGTASSPFRSIQKGVDIVNPGDVVIVKDGIYTAAGSRYPDRVVQFNRGGTAAAWVTVKAENQYGAILDGQNYSTTFGVVFFNGYINFDGFQIRNFKVAGLWMQGSPSGLQTHDIAITRNWVHHIARVMITDCADGYGRVGAYANGYVYNVKWDSNLWHDIGRIPNLACDSNLGTTPNYRHDHGLYLQGKYHTVVNNIFYNMYAGWAIKVDGFYGALSNAADASHTIVNNTFAHPAVPRESTGHIRFFTNSPAETDSGNTMLRPVNVLVANNISYNPPYWGGASASSSGPTFIAALYDGVMYYSGTVVRNNITTAASIIDEVSGGSEITSKVTFSGNRVQTNPVLMDPANNSFLLPAASAARLGGYAPNAPPYDFVGVRRPLDYPDVGAYQYVHGDSFALAVTSPTNGATLAGTIGVQVVNSVSVSTISLSVDGQTVAQMAPPFNFPLDTRTMTNGAHTLLAAAQDAAGAAYSATPVTMNVANPTVTPPVDTTPPIVTISNPRDGSRIKGPVGISVSATDNYGVAGVTLSLYIDGETKSITNVGLIKYTWNPRKVNPGTHTISARARDAAGNTASTSISVTTN